MPLVEFAYNNSVHASTQEPPFYINYGYHPQIDMLQTWKEETLATDNFATCLKKLHLTMEEHIKEAQVHYKKFANIKRKESPIFQVGDKVWLLQCKIKTSQPCNKLDY